MWRHQNRFADDVLLREESELQVLTTRLDKTQLWDGN